MVLSPIVVAGPVERPLPDATCRFAGNATGHFDRTCALQLGCAVRIPPDVSQEDRAANHDRVGVTIEAVISLIGLVCWATSKGAFKK
jgi:hypothetical protein